MLNDFPILSVHLFLAQPDELFIQAGQNVLDVNHGGTNRNRCTQRPDGTQKTGSV